MPTVTILDDYQRVALSSADWSAVRDRYPIEVVDEHIPDRDMLVRRLRDSEIVVAMRERTRFPADLLRALPALRLLVTTGMVNAAIDLDAARQQGVTVCGTTGWGNAMPELTIGMIIALTRNFAQEDAAVRAGGWQHTIGPGLAGHTLGVVGLGRLGTPVARLAQAFEMSVIAWSPHLTPQRAAPHGVRAVSKQELFTDSDVITIHMPLSETTRGLVGAADLALMKPSAYLVNTSRGPIVDEEALLAALRERRIAGAGLDVYDVEPLPVDHPLRTLRNTLLLPHIGYVTTDSYRTFYEQIVENILAWHDGAPVRLL
ncbi:MULTISPECIES: D-2-hydroxyacid dehydrogenase family protein [Protofrankia]|uniref:2-hydroxyacid dehydrogenase n=1 Tax=Protofrankia coriariae TaxID=1562887 RepID=A0ABR5F3R5_9ACTN|nr:MULTISPECIES: D-2-hydroxyacid dehydrogenase family protein [Protofrankia]KLL11340.1 2-hydroxyacid dehydrogenase [Protofrankia coriariae]ONH34894.1 hydroxyacid dehydrogenase [Protofrankia sp. BMG5.30]